MEMAENYRGQTHEAWGESVVASFLEGSSPKPFARGRVGFDQGSKQAGHPIDNMTKAEQVLGSWKLVKPEVEPLKFLGAKQNHLWGTVDEQFWGIKN